MSSIPSSTDDVSLSASATSLAVSTINHDNNIDFVREHSLLVIATRLHLGKASSPPSNDKLQTWIRNLSSMADSAQACQAVIAVDATPKIQDYDLVQAVQQQIQQLLQESSQEHRPIVVLPVTPWGRFVPALNALVWHAKCTCQAKQILFVSAEVTTSASAIQTLSQHCSSSDDVLVAGAVLEGHEYHASSSAAGASGAVTPHEVALTGRATPWNTLAVWNVDRLALTGFLPCSDVTPETAGVEECVAIAAHQKLFPNAKAKLVRLDSEADWSAANSSDPKRREWHEQKMKSKLERAAAQLEEMGLDNGKVIHC